MRLYSTDKGIACEHNSGIGLGFRISQVNYVDCEECIREQFGEALQRALDELRARKEDLRIRKENGYEH